MIMQEISRNNEAYRRNTYLYKDKGTKLRPGPLWSFELAFKNTADCNSSVDTGWCHNLGHIVVPKLNWLHFGGISYMLIPALWMR